MPQNFLSCDRDQSLLLPPDLRDWLDEDHLAWFVIEAIEELDLEPFYAAYRADGHGAAAHDPKMMLTLLAYAYASASAQRGDRAPLPRGRRLPGDLRQPGSRPRHDRPLPGPPPGGPGDLFGQVLGLCAEAGLVEVGVLAVDGSKFAAAASDSAIRTYEQIAEEILAEAGRIDAAEDEIHGEARGDELPEHLRSREGRRAWLREAKQRLDAERAAKAEPVPRDAKSGSSSATAAWSRTGGPSATQTAPTRPTERAA